MAQVQALQEQLTGPEDDGPAYDDQDANGGGMTLVDVTGALVALGVPLPNKAASNATSSSALAGGGVGKRYRPMPMFQCCGFGECRMVSSCSEHLTRHVRKHTGKHPFTCQQYLGSGHGWTRVRVWVRDFQPAHSVYSTREPAGFYGVWYGQF
ncbi:hypothetical protein B0H14DRAFT_2612185 [Mycena olivaceomarginata]|nr:hypothetical protein B0H14DRAFT_2612185 [Mycena olivaceomarginata]